MSTAVRYDIDISVLRRGQSIYSPLSLAGAINRCDTQETDNEI
jgi:hypothetical protein